METKDKDSRASAKKITQVRKKSSRVCKSKLPTCTTVFRQSGEINKTQVTTSQKRQGHSNTVGKGKKKKERKMVK